MYDCIIPETYFCAVYSIL